jgi:hypothetical protein
MERPELQEFSIQGLSDRLLLEYKMLKASTRHSVFAFSLLLTIIWLVLVHRPSEVLRKRIDIQDTIKIPMGLSKSSPDQFRAFVNSSIFSLSDMAVRQQLLSIVSGQKYKLEVCNKPPYGLKSSNYWDLSSVDGCLSDSDLVVVNSTCSLEAGSCDSLCKSSITESQQTTCLVVESVANATAVVGDFFISNQSLTLGFSPLLATVRADMAFITSENFAVLLQSVYQQDSWASISLSVFPHTKDLIIPLMVSCLAVSLAMIALDVKSIVKKHMCKDRLRWWTSLRLLHSLCVPAIVALKWSYVSNMLEPKVRGFSSALNSEWDGVALIAATDGLRELQAWKNWVDSLIFILLMVSSCRLLKILSSHPRTAILYDIITSRRTELLKLFLCFALVLGHFLIVWWWLGTDRSTPPLIILQWLIQVPFGVWPFNSDNTALLIAFGVITFHFLVVVFQVIVNAGFKQYRSKHSRFDANPVHVDVWYALKRYLARKRSKYVWPHRLVLLYAINWRMARGELIITRDGLYTELERIHKKGKNIQTEANENESALCRAVRKKLTKLHSKGLKAFDPLSVDEVWSFYASHFGSQFLDPSIGKPKQDPHRTLMDEIKKLMSRGLSPPSSEDEPLPPIEEIERRTRQLNEFAPE